MSPQLNTILFYILVALVGHGFTCESSSASTRFTRKAVTSIQPDSRNGLSMKKKLCSGNGDTLRQFCNQAAYQLGLGPIVDTPECCKRYTTPLHDVLIGSLCKADKYFVLQDTQDTSRITVVVEESTPPGISDDDRIKLLNAI